MDLVHRPYWNCPILGILRWVFEVGQKFKAWSDCWPGSILVQIANQFWLQQAKDLTIQLHSEACCKIKCLERYFTLSSIKHGLYYCTVSWTRCMYCQVVKPWKSSSRIHVHTYYHLSQDLHVRYLYLVLPLLEKPLSVIYWLRNMVQG